MTQTKEYKCPHCSKFVEFRQKEEVKMHECFCSFDKTDGTTDHGVPGFRMNKES